MLRKLDKSLFRFLFYRVVYIIMFDCAFIVTTYLGLDNLFPVPQRPACHVLSESYGTAKSRALNSGG